MKLKKENLSNFAFIIVLALLLFTPLGFHIRVLTSRIFSFSPYTIDKEDQLILSCYNWKLSNARGEVFNFKDVEGKVVLVNYWATWCPPCVGEMPSLQELYNEYGDKVEFVFVAHDEGEKVKDFMSKKEYNFPVYFEKSSSPIVLSTKSIPTTFIIDKKGKIVVRKTGAADWNGNSTWEILERLLAE
ncbi:TlpA family protein disulfide reductase [Maribacter algarum]|uniref:TlpA family protein disulfide reductase n=1 Tax=Maribacter algarum (ex Zhang et al. 2020) TaxID=2578118 RepID=A0A5S3PGW1_9FLAO|nr:TlpA disulfide reductase family protein [Maribacter algarum]TMM53373.1 TlpA family protein disulfide reductase [Maribacter algarum]